MDIEKPQTIQRDSNDSGDAVAPSVPLYANERKALEEYQEKINPTNDDKKPKKRSPTAGEVFVERVNYTGFGFGANEGISLVFTDEFEHGIGKNTFDKLSEAMAKKFPSAFKEEVVEGVVKATAKQSAGNLLMTLGLLTGGTLLLLPMKIIENNKQPLIRWANHFFDAFKNGMDEKQQLARDTEVEKAVACEPVQSWKSLILGRIAAVATTISFGQLMGVSRNNAVKDWAENNTLKPLQERNRLGSDLNSSYTKFLNSERTKRYVRLAGVETIYCTISSVALELFSKIFSKRSKVLFDEQKCQELGKSSDSACTSGSQNDANVPEKMPLEYTPSHVIQDFNLTSNHNREHVQSKENSESFASTIAKQQHQSSMDGASLSLGA